MSNYPEYTVTVKSIGEQIVVTWHPTRDYTYVNVADTTKQYVSKELDGLPDSITKFNGVL